MNDKYTLKKSIILITYACVLLMAIFNLDKLLSSFSRAITVISPVLYGAIFAFIFNLLMSKIEYCIYPKSKKLLTSKRKKLRTLSIITTFVIIIAAIALISYLVIPQLSNSVALLVENAPSYFGKFMSFVYQILDYFEIDITPEYFSSLPWEDWTKNAINVAGGLFSTIFTSTANFTGIIINLFMGFIISIYMLMNKETLIMQAKKTIVTFCPKSFPQKIFEITRLCNSILCRFITGQITEAIILGALCFIGMTVLRIPYSPLVSILIGITNIIPFFGPILGIIPSAFLILMADPFSALIFVVFILLLQQVDANIIYPRVVGDSIELPGMWVVVAIVVGGGLFGIAGMLLGVPLFAVIYAVAGKYINKKYQTKIGKIQADKND